MLDEFSPSSTEARLRAALHGGQLSAAAQAQAETLLDRLAHGVCVVVMGPKSVGKSQLCNALTGHAGHNDSPLLTRMFSDTPDRLDRFAELGEVQNVPPGENGLSQALVVDMALSDDEHENGARMCSVLDKADIVLWCTEQFDPQEAQIWAQAPDALKDHSFLVLTKADLHEDFGNLATRIKALQSVVEEEFHSLFPVTTPHVQKRLEAGNTLTDSERAASGIKALADAVESVVASGKRADLDSALLFLERHGLSDGAVPDVPVAAPQRRTGLQNTSFEKARNTIKERVLDLKEFRFDDPESDMSAVLDVCGAISEDVADILREAESDQPEVAPWCRAFEEAADKIMLMGMENDARSAADAVTILLQLRRDIEYNSVH